MSIPVTVLMTTYNCSSFIRIAIKSILIQTYSNFELLIIDDGSTDNTEEIISEFKDARIRYIKGSHLGRSQSLNVGLNNASNEIIALMDADDIAAPNRLEIQIKNFSNKINEVIFVSAAFFINQRIIFIGDLNVTHEKFYNKLALHGPYNNSTALFHKNHILLNGGFNNSLTIGEDQELWLRLKDISSFIQVPEILYFIRFRESSLTFDHFNSKKNVTFQLLQKYYENLQDSFGLKSVFEQYKLRGWREFFYGSKKNIWREWSKVKIRFWNLKMIFAYVFSFLPDNFLNWFKQNRINLKIRYWIFRIFSKNSIQKNFNKLIFRLTN